MNRLTGSTIADSQRRRYRVAPRQFRSRRGRSLGAWLTMIGFTLLVAMPIVAVEGPREIARWLAAAGHEAFLERQYVRAVAFLDRAIEWSPADPVLYLTRAQFRIELEQWESALQDAEVARGLAPTDTNIRPLRSQLLLHNGRYQQAVAEQQAALQWSSQRTRRQQARLLNELAYTRAVGNLQLPQGLQNAHESLALLGDRLAALDPVGILHFAHGFSLFNQGDYDRSLASLEEAACSAQRLVQRRTSQIAVLAADPRGAVEYVEDLEALRPHLAGILRLKASVLDQLGRSEDARQNRLQIEELARDGNVSVAEPYELPVAVDRVTDVCNVVDTRGFLLYRLGELSAARHDLDRAVAAAQALCDAMPWLIEVVRHQVTDLRPLQRQIRQLEHSLAVITYHRLLVLEGLGLSELAAADRATIVQLGFEPGDHLF